MQQQLQRDDDGVGRGRLLGGNGRGTAIMPPAFTAPPGCADTRLESRADITPDGETLLPNAERPADCFFVHPTGCFSKAYCAPAPFRPGRWLRLSCWAPRRGQGTSTWTMSRRTSAAPR